MSLIIRKKSAYTWEHYFDGATVPYITNVFNINNGGNNTFQLVDYRGSNLQAVPITDITLYDDTSGGIAETFSTFAELNTRLGILQYPPMKTSGGGGGGVESVSGVLLNNTDPLNPIVNGLIVDAYSQVKEIEFDGATVTNDGSGKVTVTITDSGVTEFIELTDVPASYTGQGSKVVAVKVDESGLEFVAGGGGTTPTLQAVTDVGNETTNDITTFGYYVNDGIYKRIVVSETGTVISYGELQLRENSYETTGFYGVFLLETLTFQRSYSFPDKDGTVAMLDDITTPPDATPTVKGIAKLYTSLGSNTDGAVDQNTVNSALALKANIQNVEQIIRSKSNGTFGSHTGDTAETVIAVIDIDANEFEAGDWMTLLFSGEKDASAGNVTWRLRAGVNGNTSDSQIAILTATSVNSRYCALYRGRPQFLTGNQLRIWGITGSAFTDIAVSGAPTLVSLTPTSAWKLTVTAQLTVSTETASLTGYRIGKIKSF